MDSITYRRSLELSNEQTHAKPLNDSPATLSRCLTILQSPYFNGHEKPTFPSSDGNSYVYVIVDAFTHYVVLHPTPRKDAANVFIVLFDLWKVEFGIPDILVTDNGNEYNNGNFAYFCRRYIMYNLNHAHLMHHGQMN